MSPVAIAPIPVGEKCVLCECRLTTAYLIERGLCGSCSDRPEAKTLPRDATGKALPRPRPQPSSVAQVSRPAAVGEPRLPRAFTAADKALIRSLHTQLPATELLRILNDRLLADLGAAAVLYPLEQLRAELTAIAPAPAAADWAGVRQLLASARRSGVLALITPTLVEDFAIVFALSPAQLLHLKDVIASAKEGK